MDKANQVLAAEQQVDRRISLRRLFFLYVLIGLTGFGPTLATETRKRLVQNESWLKEEDFVNGLSLAQLLPGATFVNLAVYAGYKLRGMAGAVTGFAAILLMPFMLMLLLAHVYFSYHSVEAVSILFKGTTVVIVGVIANAVIELGRTTIRDGAAGMIALTAAGLMFTFKNPFAVLLAAAFAGILLYYRFFQSQSKLLAEPQHIEKNKSSYCGRRVWTLAVLGAIAAIIMQIAPLTPVFTKLWWVFFRMGAVLFGGGLAMIPVIQQEIVDYYGWLSLDEFAVGIALSQVTPGPVLIIATFIGYKVAAVGGAIAATLGIFFPSLLLVMSTAEIHQRIRNNSWVRAALQGIAASFTGMMVVMIWGLGRYALTDIPAFVVATFVFCVLRLGRLNIITAIIAGTIVYMIVKGTGLLTTI
ncbi:putative chromate transport protein [Sporomusa silvacetica DSM 10669]|uniref:Chromate transport protein n=1 Tax=Sporomusa silvacetica DSM 10669 TaxID=1123289 RepID=A0ABZ3IGY7_9FIRM|nr:chromate efflux transporter [Sporomusa silvacetica]OZC21410.1 putative chromate transport protein [Sporomusa silvacetica DSM 10669]